MLHAAKVCHLSSLRWRPVGCRRAGRRMFLQDAQDVGCIVRPLLRQPPDSGSRHHMLHTCGAEEDPLYLMCRQQSGALVAFGQHCM